jgi:hypothetical protein
MNRNIRSWLRRGLKILAATCVEPGGILWQIKVKFPRDSLVSCSFKNTTLALQFEEDLKETGFFCQSASIFSSFIQSNLTTPHFILLRKN